MPKIKNYLSADSKKQREKPLFSAVSFIEKMIDKWED